MTLGRRVFLTTLALAGGAFGIFRSWHGIKVFLAGAKRRAEPTTGRNVFRRHDKSLVSAVGGRDLKEMILVQ